MNKSFKRFISTMLVACMAISMVAGAAGTGATKIGDMVGSENGITPRYIVTCPGGDKHAMEGRGIGLAYYGAYPSSDLRIRGTAFQCTKCNLVLITQNNPLQVGVTWGDYATRSYNDPLPANIIVYTDSFGYSNNNADLYIRGFNFGRGRMPAR